MREGWFPVAPAAMIAVLRSARLSAACESDAVQRAMVLIGGEIGRDRAVV